MTTSFFVCCFHQIFFWFFKLLFRAIWKLVMKTIIITQGFPLRSGLICPEVFCKWQGVIFNLGNFGFGQMSYFCNIHTAWRSLWSDLKIPLLCPPTRTQPSNFQHSLSLSYLLSKFKSMVDICFNLLFPQESWRTNLPCCYWLSRNYTVCWFICCPKSSFLSHLSVLLLFFAQLKNCCLVQQYSKSYFVF